MTKITNVEDHGIWRGTHHWTVTVDGPSGSCGVYIRKAETEDEARAKALETYASRKVRSAEEIAAIRRFSAAFDQATNGR